MGLCKCPKKKVTNQFCFEHRVNVCEHCIVAEHTTCVVQSYLQWLNDSEYDPKCVLCKKELTKEPCVRLVCYDVFHASCLSSWGAAHPSHTAPAGFKCPVCSAALFPAPQLASPVALALKDTLNSWDWARKALGGHVVEVTTSWNKTNVDIVQNGTVHSVTSSNKKADAPTSVISVSAAPTSSSLANASASTSQVSLQSTHRKTPSPDSLSLEVLDDADTDDNKYKRRPLLTWFKRWWRSHQPLGTNVRAGGRRRWHVLLGALVFATFLVLLIRARNSRLYGESHDDDPVFDPLNNPNIHVQEVE